MLGLRITTKRELDLWIAMIDGLKEQLKAAEQRAMDMESWARASVDQERKRSDGMMNLVLAKTTGMVVTPPTNPEAMLHDALSLFGSEELSKEEDEKLRRQIEAVQQ